MKIAEKWGFGMAPPRPEVQRARIEAVTTVGRLIDNEPITLNLPEALEHISVVKGLFNRIAREDQWDWFYVKRQFGYPEAGLAKAIGFALSNFRGALRDNDSQAVSDIRISLKRFPLKKCFSIFLGTTDIKDEPNAGWVYVLSTREQPNFLKIGMTTRTVEERVREINTATGVLIPFGVRRCWRVMEPSRGERLVHSALKQYRIRDDREFFSVDIREADPVIRAALNDQRLLLRTLENLAALSGD